jgi:hypothetical protein
MSQEGMKGRTCANIPDDHTIVRGSGGDLSAIRTEHHNLQVFVMGIDDAERCGFVFPPHGQ